MRQAELAGSNQGGDRSLEELLPLAVREPKHVATKDGGALLALCVHCVIVDSGFTVNADRRLGSSPLSPAADWNGKFDNEWVLEYTRKGFLSAFTIHCSLQSASGRMFVHAREHDNPSNMRYMGLTLGKYIPDVRKARSESWQGIVHDQELLRQSLHELIIEPLLGSAMPVQDAPEEPKTGIWQKLPKLSGTLSNWEIWLYMAALTSAGAVIYLYMSRRQRLQAAPSSA